MSVKKMIQSLDGQLKCPIVCQFLDKMKDIQDNILNYLENDNISNDNFTHLQQLFLIHKIRDNKYDFIPLLHLIVKISKNYIYKSSQLDKIFQIIIFLQDDIKKYLINSEIFNIFESHKRLLLFLIDLKIIQFNKEIAQIIIQEKYVQKSYPLYFLPELKAYVKEEWFPKYDPTNDKLSKNSWVEMIQKEELPDNFYEFRQKGENHNYICKLIRKDSVEDFITFITKEFISIKSTIPYSIYETNSFLLKKDSNPTLIEYATYFGSIQIFNYLRLNNAEMNPILWIYSIHGNNAEIIHLIEEYHIDFEKKEDLILESIKCYRNDIKNYFENCFNHLTLDYLSDCFKFYNFEYISNDSVDQYHKIMKLIYTFCSYDYYTFVDLLLKKKIIDINQRRHTIFKYFSLHFRNYIL